MKVGSTLYLFGIVLLVFISCKSIVPKSRIPIDMINNQTWRTDNLCDSTWFDFIQNEKDSMYQAWNPTRNVINEYSGPPYDEAYNLFKSNDDWARSEKVPVEIFTIDPLVFLSSKKDTNIHFESLLKLNRDKSELYIVKDLKFYYSLSTIKTKSKWIPCGYGPIYKDFADSLSALYYNKKLRFFRVYIPQAFGGSSYTVYRKDGKLYSLILGGASREFKDYLSERLY